MSDWTEGYHFLRADRRLGYGDNREVIVGETLTVEGDPVLCIHGLHASPDPLSALDYAPGLIVCRVRLGGVIVYGDDKAVATERTVLAMADATEVAVGFAQWCADEAESVARDAARAASADESASAARAAAWAARDARDDEVASGAAWAAASAARVAASAARAATWAAAWATQAAELTRRIDALLKESR